MSWIYLLKVQICIKVIKTSRLNVALFFLSCVMFIHISRYWVHAVQPSQCSPPVSMGDEPDQAPSHPASDHSRLGPRCDPAGFPLHLQIPSISQTSQGGNDCPKQWARWKRWTSIRGLASGHEVNFTQQTKKQTRVCFAFLCLTLIVCSGTGVSLAALFFLCGLLWMTH